jgi:hypothetical protein
VPAVSTIAAAAVNLMILGAGPAEFSRAFAPGAVGCALALLAAGLWWNAPAIGRQMTLDQPGDSGSTPLTAETALSVAFATVGLYIVATWLQTFVQIATLVGFARYTFGNLWRDKQWQPTIIQDGLMIVIGVWLMFGGRGVVRLVARARQAPQESSAANSTDGPQPPLSEGS